MSTKGQGRPSLDALLRPRSVAVVGASSRAGSVGSNIIENLRHAGFSGSIYPVNPRYPEIHGLKAYGSLSEIGEPIDAVFIAVAAEHGPGVMRQVVEAGAQSVLLNATGYADAGPEGRARQDEIVALAEKAGIPVCGPNNLGLVNIADAVPLWSAGHLPSMSGGSVAIVSQSGSVALALGDDVAGLGLSHVITCGNEAVTGAGDYIAALADDARVRLILLFLETIRDPARLAEAAARAIAAGQTIIAVKVGRSEAARAAVAAHSGALSGEDAVVDAFFRQTGILRARDLDDMVQIARLKLLPPPSPEARAAYITLSGGQGAAIADAAADCDLSVVDFPASVVERLQPLFGEATPHNPCDAWGLGWDAGWFAEVFDKLLAAPEIDPIVFTLDVPASGAVDGPMAVDMATIAAGRERLGKVVIFSANSAIAGVNPELQALCRENGFPVLLGTSGALRALKAWSEPVPVEGLVVAPAGSLTRADLEDRLASEVRFVPSRRASDPAQAAALAESLGFPVVVKGIAPAATHKTELGLVRLNLSSRDAVEEAYGRVAEILRSNAATLGEGWVEVQPMIPAGVEMLVAARRDPQFGLVTVVGAGGKLVELIADSVLRLGPVSAEQAGAMIGETRVARLLSGYRDGITFDIEAAQAAIVAVSSVIAEAGPEVTSVEINPLIVLPKGHGAIAVDLVIE